MHIVSGGQTGVDRAALDLALELGIPCGGWCPKGRKAQDGALAVRYPLKETPTGSYAQRTQWNVRDSDGTLVLTFGQPRGGTRLTVALANRCGKPCLVIDLSSVVEAGEIKKWLVENRIQTLNVAGPRESETRGAYERARSLLRQLFEPLKAS